MKCIEAVTGINISRQSLNEKGGFMRECLGSRVQIRQPACPLSALRLSAPYLIMHPLVFMCVRAHVCEHVCVCGRLLFVCLFRDRIPDLPLTQFG